MKKALFAVCLISWLGLLGSCSIPQANGDPSVRSPKKRDAPQAKRSTRFLKKHF